jgi:glycosyltransferase involved in cell wall biosynthesis
MDVTSLSIFIIAHNEADRIGRTLQAVQHLSDDIVVIDSGSTDGTQQIAASYGARVIPHAWTGYGPQKRFAEDQCRHAWLLNLDADEVVPPDLAAEITGVFATGEPAADAYTIRIAEIFPSEPAPHRFAYALTPVRLYNKNKGRYVESTVHDRVGLVAGAKIARLKGTIHHFSVRSLGDQMNKLNRYTDMQVLDLMRRGKKPSKLAVLFEFPLAFFKAYILRRHFLRGFYGIMTAMNYAFYRYLRRAKHLEASLLEKHKITTAPAQNPM